MCGIVAIIGKEKIKDKLTECLEKLEYRGYDSAGIATLENHDFKVTKQVGKVSLLKQTLQNEIHTGHMGIAHTRWATHGGVSQINAHPFCTENWCLVHNGIINNFEQLKSEYNITTTSQTDTEVIVRLLEKQEKQNIDGVIEVCSKLKGSYALAILNKNTSEIYFAKNSSPLFITKTENMLIGASDVVCFADFSHEFFRFEDGEFASATINKITFFDKNKNIINKKPQEIRQINYETTKENYSHYMEKEIFETPKVIRNIYETYFNKNMIDIPKNILKNINRVKFIGCGTAYHSTLFGAKYFEKVTKIESSSHLASEFENEFLTKRTLCVFVSQSGETADTINAVKIAKKKGCPIIAITNVMHSTLSGLADFCLPILAGVEIAVASTKAYCAQIIVMEIFANHFANKKQQEIFQKKLKKFAYGLKMPKKTTVNAIINHLINADSCFILGRGKDYYTARESALKIKEITYINCTSLPSGELKHGTLALVDDIIPLIMFCTNKKELDKSLSAKKEIEARGGRVLFLTPDKTLGNNLQQTYDEFMPVCAILPVQLAAYQLSCLKSINPDQPRNLAKSVTVE